MRLELKHLAPYLPYGLKCWAEEKLTFSEFFESNVDAHTYEMGVISMMGVLKGNGKPILRPLSDLSKTEDGIINEHDINSYISEKYNLDYGIFSQFKGELDIELDGDSDLRYDPGKTLSFNVVIDIYNKLLEGHYDIFNLIPEGLAIDKNTLTATTPHNNK